MNTSTNIFQPLRNGGMLCCWYSKSYRSREERSKKIFCDRQGWFEYEDNICIQFMVVHFLEYIIKKQWTFSWPCIACSTAHATAGRHVARDGAVSCQRVPTRVKTSGGSWWNCQGGLRNFISGWTYGIVALAVFIISGVSSHSSSPNLIKLVIFSCPY